MSKKLRCAILGTGNIGTDLLIKVIRSNSLECTLFSGRNFSSDGMQKAVGLGINISDQGINAIIKHADQIDIVFDATSAAAHIEHWPVIDGLGKIAIDMTPAKLGDFCVPAINSMEICDSGIRNINMVTCGGQASVPIAAAIAAVHSNIDYIEAASSIASRSAGPATRANLDEYVDTTEYALLKFSGAKKAKAILILNPANPPIDMQTTIYAKIEGPNIEKIQESVSAMMKLIEKYVPGYQLLVPPTLVDRNRVMTTVKVLGNGDYLPKYAGNLDIINCAAVGIAENLAAKVHGANR
ncbi:acetaldehyde dehydrogenase (acetylating) [Pseudomonadales bacterium]|nr:acetaldehyde dehydrogenase (acetylating) [Pseudomonadales bacterium]